MKRLLFSLAFVATMLTSCISNNAEIDYSGKDAVDVVIGVATPEIAGSRAGESDMDSGLGAIDNFSADEWAKYDMRYMLEVYDITSGYADYDTPVKNRMVQTFDQYQETRFELRLIPKRTYKIVVWADFVLQGSEADLNYNTKNLQNITRNGNAAAMDESMDAYFIQEDITLNGALSKDLVLTRPFGKLRVVTTDIDEANIGSAPSKVDITFENHPTFVSLNALTGNTESYVDTVTYSYDVAKDAPYSQGHDSKETHQTLFADYIFAQPQEDGAQEVNFTMTITGEDNRVIREHDFNTQIPLQRNHLTTIMGNMLTTSTQFTVSIDDNFDSEYIVNSEAVKLDTPVVTCNIVDKSVTLSWDAIENADYYSITYLDSRDTVQGTEAIYTLNWGDAITFSVQAHSYDTWTYNASDSCDVYVEVASRTSTIYFTALNRDMEQVRIYYWDLNGESLTWPGVFMDYAYTNAEGFDVFTYTFDEQYYNMHLNLIFNNGLGGTDNQTEDLSCILDQDHYFEFNLNANNIYENDNNGFKIYATNDNGWSSMNIWLWDADGQSITNNNFWPGDAMSKEYVDGVEYFVYTLPEDTYYYNIVFNTNNGIPQTVDVIDLTADRDRYFRVLSNTNNEGKYLVEETT